MFRPEDLEEISFDRTFMGGYKLEEVEDFVNKISSDFISLYNENDELKKKLKIVVEKIEGYRSKENLISEALLHAQSLKESAVLEADKIILKAKEESAEIVKAAGEEAARLSAAARSEFDEQIEKLKEDIQYETDKLNAIKKEVSDFKGKIQELYKTHLTSIMNIPNYDGPALEMKKESDKVPASRETEPSAQTDKTAEHKKPDISPIKIQDVKAAEAASIETSDAKVSVSSSHATTEIGLPGQDTSFDILEHTPQPQTMIFEPSEDNTDKSFSSVGKTIVMEDEKKPDTNQKPEKPDQTIFKKSLSGIFDFSDGDDSDKGGSDSFSFILNKKK